MKELYEQLRHIKEKHESAKNHLVEAQKINLAKPNEKGHIAALLVTYRNELDILKQDVSDAIKMLNTEDK